MPVQWSKDWPRFRSRRPKPAAGFVLAAVLVASLLTACGSGCLDRSEASQVLATPSNYLFPYFDPVSRLPNNRHFGGGLGSWRAALSRSGGASPVAPVSISPAIASAICTDAPEVWFRDRDGWVEGTGSTGSWQIAPARPLRSDAELWIIGAKDSDDGFISGVSQRTEPPPGHSLAHLRAAVIPYVIAIPPDLSPTAPARVRISEAFDPAVPAQLRALQHRMPELTEDFVIGSSEGATLHHIRRVVALEFEFRRRVDEDGNWLDSDAGATRAPAYLTLPATDVTGTAVFVHGLKACKEAAFGPADMFAAQGIATVTWDIAGHGVRGFGSKDFVCGESNPWDFWGRFNPAQIGGQMLQSAYELNQILLALPEAMAPYSVTSTARNTAVVGHSMGAFIVMAALRRQSVAATVLNASGGDLTTMLDHFLTDAHDPAGFFDAYDYVDPQVAGHTLAWVDPAANAFDVLSMGNRVLFQQPDPDQIIPRIASVALARALGTALSSGTPLRPGAFPPETIADRVASGMAASRGYDWGHHLSMLLPRYFWENRVYQYQAARFISSAFEGAAEVTDATTYTAQQQLHNWYPTEVPAPRR